MMIQEALARARDTHTGRVATLSFVRSVAGEAVRHGSRGFKIVVACVFVLLTGTVVFLIWELYRTRAELRDINLSKMGPSEIGEWIADQNKTTIFLLIYRTNTGFEQGFCTGFAANYSQLLTNAHCVMQMKKLASEGAVFFAAQNEGMGVRYRVARWSAHPGYNPASPTPTADVGVADVEGRLPRIVALAAIDQVKTLRAGSEIFVFGFPGDLNNVGSPVATITNGVIGRLTALDGQAADPERQYLLQYSAFTSKGTSGSPVFDNYGRVIAINSGYYQGKSRVVIENPTTGKSEDANVSRDLSGYAFGIRIDLAQEVFR
jgi:V8-like Glu-specific endopeptidase